MRTATRISLVLGAAAVALALSASAAGAQGDYPPGASGPVVGSATPGPGDCVDVSQSGLTPGAIVIFTFTDANGTTTSVTAVADATGTASTQLCVPDNAAAGPGTITAAVGGQVLGVVQVNTGTAQDDDGELAFTGSSTGNTLMVAVLAVVVGGVLVALSRRREGVSS